MGNIPKPGVAEITPENVIDVMSAPAYRPLEVPELLAAMGLKRKHAKPLQQVLDDLLAAGRIVLLRHKGYVCCESADLLVGTIRFTRSGKAFVIDLDGRREAFIAKKNTSTAFPGDRVLVRLHRRVPGRTTGRSSSAEGTVIRIIERRTEMMSGTLRKMRRVFFVEPLRPDFSRDILVADIGSALVGDRVTVRLTEWTDPRMNPEGDIVDVLGHADDPSIDTESVIHSYGLSTSFSPDAMRESQRQTITDRDFSDRLDFRKRYVFTIDPDTARDYDDAISLEKTSGGKWLLGVHIADAAHFIKQGSKLDKAALERATSTYFTDSVLPMLPESLSNDLCSLRADRDRLTLSVLIRVDDAGSIDKVTFGESVIRNRVRLTYGQALQAIQLPDGAAMPEAGLDRRGVRKVKRLHAFAQRFRKKRLRDGALDMSIPEVRVETDEDGHISAIHPVVNDVAHQAIEECMLLANEQVSRELTRRNVTFLHRIHDEPDPQRLADLEELLLVAGFETGDLTDRKNILRLLRDISRMDYPYAWYTQVLRSLKKAEYSISPIGHYGLAKSHYCHFTSPIRRYPDLVNHRILKALLRKKPIPYTKTALAELARHCSEREVISTGAERDLVELKIMRFFRDQLNSGNLQQFHAIVVGVGNFGLSVDLPEVQARGLVHVSMLANDFFDFNPVRKELVGRDTGTVYGIGSNVKVVIAKINEDRRFLDFVPVAAEKRGSKSSRRKRQGRGRRKNRK